MEQLDEDVLKEFLKLKFDFMDKKAPALYQSISTQQAKTTGDFPAIGTAWASRTTLPVAPDNNIADHVIQSIRGLGDGSEKLAMPAIKDVRVQWSGHRQGVSRNAQEPSINEKEKYHNMTKDATKKSIILYCHGGFYCTGSPATYRKLTVELARLTGGRCLVLDHRLSPQHPFPAALIDALVAYLSLLYPTSKCFHEAFQPQDIVFVGDSAGANIALSLLLLIRDIRSRSERPIQLNGEYFELLFPAGFASVGCQLDLTCSFPFSENNKRFDILLPTPPCLSEDMPSCGLWPSHPARADIYCDVSLLCHPLVSPVAARSFSSLPPMFFAYGEEYLEHEGRFFCQSASREQVIIEFHQYQRLLHAFPLLYPDLPQSKHCLAELARFCTLCVHESKALEVRSVTYPATREGVRPVGDSFLPRDDSGLDLARVLSRMNEARSRRRMWTGPSRLSHL